MIEKHPIITIFGSSHPKEGDEDYELAYEVGKELALAGFVICNGGYGGTMEAAARGAKESGGKTIGITFANPFSRTANAWIDEELIQPTLVSRLMKLIELGDAYIVLKGGTGTLLEFAAIWEFINKHILKEKPIVLLGNFWMNVVRHIMDEVNRETFKYPMKYIHCVRNPSECVTLLKSLLPT